MWRHPSSFLGNTKSVWKEGVHIIVDLLVFDHMHSKRKETRGENFSFFSMIILYNIHSSLLIYLFIYLFHLARLCGTVVVEFISFSEAMWRGNSSFMNWGFHVQKLLFTFFVSNIETVVSQNSLQLFTYQIGYYFASIHFRTVHNFQKQILTGGSNSSKETAKKKKTYLFVELSLCYSFSYQISKEETIFFNETGEKRKNLRCNLDIPTSLNRDLRNIPFLRGGERGEGGGRERRRFILGKIFQQ